MKLLNCVRRKKGKEEKGKEKQTRFFERKETGKYWNADLY